MVVETRRSLCNRDCPDACGLIAEVEGDRLVALRGDPDHPVTAGFLCFRTSRFPALAAGPDRVRAPLIRRGGKLVETSLDEALDLVAERLLAIRAESGPAAIFHYRSGGSLGLLKHLADRFFDRFGPCTVKTGDICSGAGEAAQIADFGVSDSNDLLDLVHARHILMWGRNPFVSSVHLVPVLKRAQAAGARITSIDPVFHKGATLADDALHPWPGGDLALALGVGRALWDRGALDPADLARCVGVDGYVTLIGRHPVAGWARLAGVEPAAPERLADVLLDGPTAILVGWGMQRRGHGAATVRALDALSAVTGNLFRSGGGCSFYFRRRAAFAGDDPGAGRPPRAIREPLFAADVMAATDPPIRAMWITAGNPVAMLPDSARVAEAIERTEFVVVVDPLLTDTGRRADVVLPVPTLLEDSDVLGSYGHHWIGESRPLVPPPPGVVHELELLQRLAERVGLAAELAGSVDDWKRRFLAPAAARGVGLEDLRDGAKRSPFAPVPVLFADGRVATPDGRVRLLGELPPGALDEPPADGRLWLFSNSVAEAQASQWSGIAPERLPVTVHPDAAPAGLAAGATVRIAGEAGELIGTLRLDDRLRPDIAVVPKGGSLDRGTAANALIAARATDAGLGAAYLDCRIRLSAP